MSYCPLPCCVIKVCYHKARRLIIVQNSEIIQICYHFVRELMSVQVKRNSRRFSVPCHCLSTNVLWKFFVVPVSAYCILSFHIILSESCIISLYIEFYIFLSSAVTFILLLKQYILFFCECEFEVHFNLMNCALKSVDNYMVILGANALFGKRKMI